MAEDTTIGAQFVLFKVEVADLEIPCKPREEDDLFDSESVVEEKQVLESKPLTFEEIPKHEQLRAVLELYQRALEDLKTFTSEKSLNRHFDMSNEAKLFDRLQTTIESPDFLEKLGSMHEAADKVLPVPNGQDEHSSWDLITEGDLVSGDLKDTRNCLDHESYVFVSPEDIVEGMACFMARYVSSLPQTKEMTPKQLQNALKKAFGVSKKGKLRKLWNGSKALYTAVSWGASAVSLYNNPALVQAASVAFWTSFRVITKFA